MKGRLTIAAIAIGLAGSAGALHAQYISAPQVASTGVGAEGGYDAARVRAELDRAHELARSGRFVDALRAYRGIAKRQKAAGVLAGEALWNAAQLEFGQGGRHQLRAAEVLDELAQQASLYGDPVLQAKALIEAAILYQTHGRPAEALACIQRLQPLLQSPHLSSELRQEIESRMQRS